MPKEVTIVQCVRRQDKAPDEEESSRHSCACPSCPAHNTLRSDQNLSRLNSTTERISTEMLIEAVKRRPVLWNPDHPEHAKREERQRVWTEMVHEFYGTELKQDQKSYLC
ncbi:hypothetical protein EVAR_95701_1 [Eumeta japonica]|uniref:MADF domain-containing protein n=1 Tax=Eumeta variegata TaxID=151549 RepID=A0A4C1VK92_EUMVA|nr:hypothetical protein EVAR_95701_1 [Eumeta japonica]